MGHRGFLIPEDMSGTWTVLMMALGRVGRTLLEAWTSVSTDKSSNCTSIFGALIPNLQSINETEHESSELKNWWYLRTHRHYLALPSPKMDISSSCSTQVIEKPSNFSMQTFFPVTLCFLLLIRTRLNKKLIFVVAVEKRVRIFIGREGPFKHNSLRGVTVSSNYLAFFIFT